MPSDPDLGSSPAAVDEPRLQSDWPTEPAGPRPPRRGPLAFMKELPVLIVLAFALALLMKTFLLQMFYIPSESMVPTLLIGDRVAVNKLAYRFRDPRRGEVIVFIAQHGKEQESTFGKIRQFLTEGLGVTRPPDKDFIKRIIGLPGETIEVTKRNVFITPVGGKRFKLDEPYIRLEGDNFSLLKPFVVPQDKYFVMGDNRNNSSDSRSSLGPISRSDIIGKAFVKIYPLKRIALINTPTYEQPAGKKKAAEGKASGIPRAPVPIGLAFAGSMSMVAVRRRSRLR